jgi:hypothetical protein
VKPDTLTLRQLNRATLARQLLLTREQVSAVDAVERLCGMQAQEAKPPFVGVWARVEGFRREELCRALLSHDVVRATLMRATLHLMSAQDYVALRATLAPAMAQAMKVLGKRAEGIDLDGVLPVARELFDQRPMSFSEARALLVERFPDVDDRALGYAVRLHLPLVMVPTEDRWAFPSVASFTPADGWVGAVSGNGAPEALVLRYLAAFGPATASDAQTWSGLPGLKPVFERLRPELRVFEDERGRELFDLPDAPRPDGNVPAPPRFLPEFDNLVLAHADRTRVVADEHRPLLVTKNLRVRATFLWDGFARGTWEVERNKGSAVLRLTPFEALPKRAVKELETEGERLLRFVGEDATAFQIEMGESAT